MDERLQWLEYNVTTSLEPRPEELKSLFSNNKCIKAIDCFFAYNEKRELYVYFRRKPPGRYLIASTLPPDCEITSKFLIFIKKDSIGKILGVSDFQKNACYFEWNPSSVLHFAMLTRNVFLPHFNSEQTLACKSHHLIQMLHNIMGNFQIMDSKLKGETILSVPNMDVLTQATLSGNRRLNLIHVLETTLIGWMKQIKGAMKIDIGLYLKENRKTFPQLYDEIKFWEMRLNLLQSLNEQLCSSQMINVLLMLEEVKSSYCDSFHYMKQNINQAENETQENLIFLGTLKKYITKIESSKNVDEIVKLFSPLFQTILLVWTYSRYYHLEENLLRLLNMLANLVMVKAQDLIASESDKVALLQKSLQLCSKFRGAYLDFKEKADAIVTHKLDEEKEQRSCDEEITWYSSSYRNSITPRGVGLFKKIDKQKEENNNDVAISYCPWPDLTSHCFFHLNIFTERCNDVLELAEATNQFERLCPAANIGAANSQVENNQLLEIQEIFTSTSKTISNELMETLDVIQNKHFELSFYRFRSTVRDLETQLGSILVGCLKSCWDVRAKLRLLDVFEGITKRSTVQAVLHQALESLVDEVMSEVDRSKKLLSSNQMKEHAWHMHLPSFTNQILWVRSLYHPTKNIIETLTAVAPMCLKSEIGWKIKDAFYDLQLALQKKEALLLQEWMASLASDLLEKSTQAILVINKDGIFKVNFNEDLQKCLQEAQCLTSIADISLPEEFISKFNSLMKNEILCYVTRLNVAVSQYIEISKNMSTMEKILLQEEIDKAKKLLNHGLNNLTWRDNSLEDFIEDCVYVISNQLCSVSSFIQNNNKTILQITKSWNIDACEFFASTADSENPSSVVDWNKNIIAFCQDSNSKVKSDINKIDKLLEGILLMLLINQSSPEWREYKEHVKVLIDDGIMKAITTSFKHLHNKMVMTSLQGKSSSSPLIKVDLMLIDSQVQFIPPLLGGTYARKSLDEYLLNWIDNILSKKEFMNTVPDMEKDKENETDERNINSLVESITRMVTDSIDQCSTVKNIFQEYSFLWVQDLQHSFEEFLEGNMILSNQSYEQNNEKEFIPEESSMSFGKYAQHDSGSRCSTTTAVTSGVSGLKKMSSKTSRESKTKPSLTDFENEIEALQKIMTDVLTLDNHVLIGWLQLDLQPIKHTIASLSSKWLHTYTDYLSKQVISFMESDTVFTNIEPIIENISGNEAGISALMKLMKVFNKVTQQQMTIDKTFAGMKSTISVLHKFNIKLPTKVEEFYTTAPYRWSNLKMKVNQAKQKLGPQIQVEQHNVVKVLKEFREQCRNVWFEIEDSKIYSRDCTVSKSFPLIEQFSMEVKDIEDEAQDLMELQLLLDKKVVDFNVIPRMKNVLVHLKQVWETFKIIEDRHNEWMRHCWTRIKTKLLKRGLDAQYELVKSLPEEAHGWDVTLSMIEMINNISSCLPVMEDLSKASLRPRHWKHLRKVAGNNITASNEAFTKMTLKEFLELGLQYNSTEVCSIVLKSTKDIALENALKLYEEVWLSKVFETKKHTRLINPENVSAGNNSYAGSEFGGTESEFGFSSIMPVGGARRSRLMSMTSMAFSGIVNFNEDQERFLICNVDMLLEELYSHQISLQTMSQDSAASPFLDEINKWQKTLQSIELIILVLVELQNKWLQLDEVFTSTELRVGFPHETALFYASSQEFHNIMKQIYKNPNVMQTCLKSNLLHHIEKLNISLAQCRKVIVHMLEKRRHKYPRLLLLSQDDAYDVLCKGYDPTLCSSIANLFPGIKEVHSEVSTKSNVYNIVGYTSLAGESIRLSKAIACENGAEHWLPNFHLAMNQSLKEELFDILQSSIETEVESLHNVDSKVSEEFTGNVDRSYVFTFILKTVLPLPEKWTFNLSSDSLVLSLKHNMTQLLNECYTSFIQGNKHSLSNLGNTMKAVITALSDFLFAQRKIQITKIKASGNRDMDPTNIDIVGSTGNICASQSLLADTESENVDHVLKPYQIFLIRNLIQYYSVEDAFVSEMMKVLDGNFDEGSSFPAEWFFHPKYLHDGDNDLLNINVGDMQASYQFDFQGRFNECYSYFGSLHSLYWFLTGFTNAQCGYMIQENESCDYVGSQRYMESLFGRYIYVYNCSTSTSVSCVLNYFKGALTSGAWIGFSNLESASHSLLSVIGNQMKMINNAIQTKQSTIILNHEEINVIPNTVVFIHTQRDNKLPISVCKHFHFVKFNLPDKKVILKINMIKSAMFLATNLVDNIVQFLSLVQKLLPSLTHVLNFRKIESLSQSFYNIYGELLQHKDGQIIAKELSSVTEITIGSEKEDEDMGVLEDVKPSELSSLSLLDVNNNEVKKNIEMKLQYKAVIIGLHQELTPALRSDEINSFEHLLGKSFLFLNVKDVLQENVQQKSLLYGQSYKDELLEDDIIKGTETVFDIIERMSHTQCWLDVVKQKVIQLVELIASNNVVVIRGNNESVACQTIQNMINVYKKFNEKIHHHVINLNAIDFKDLFGWYCHTSRRWKSGIIPTVLQQIKGKENHFIVFDGQISKNKETEFLHFLNADGQFRLTNGEVINIGSKIKFLWKVSCHGYVCMDTLHATLHISDDDVTINHQLTHHFQVQHPASSEHLITLFQHVFESVQNYLAEENLRLKVKIYNIVQNAIVIFEAIASHVQISSDYDNYVFYAVFWSFFSNMDHGEGNSFSKWWNEKWSSELGFPFNKQVWSFFVNPDTHLFTDVEDSLLFSSIPNSDMMIHSELTLGKSYLIHALVKCSQSLLINGTYGCGKSALLIKEILQHKPDGSDFDTLFIDVNECLTCNVVWDILNKVMEWKHSTYYLPANNKKIICILEDLHLLKLDNENASSVASLLHQLVVNKKAFNPSKQQWQEFDDVVFIMSYNHKEVDVHENSAFNFINQLPNIHLPYPEKEDQINIFYTLLLQHFVLVEDQQLFLVNEDTLTLEQMKRKREVLSLEDLLKILVTITVEVQENLKEMFLKTTSRNHYQFTLKKLYRLFKRFCITVEMSWDHDFLVKCWYYEVYWLYNHLFINEVDRSRFQQTFHGTAKKSFTIKQMETLSEPIPVFAKYDGKGGSNKSTPLSDLQSNGYHSNALITELQTYLKQVVGDHNRENQPIRMFYYEEYVRLVFRLVHSLDMPFYCSPTFIYCEGSCITASMLVHLTASIANIDVHQILPSFIASGDDISFSTFKQELKDLLLKCGLKNMKVLLMISELNVIPKAVYVLIEEVFLGGTMAHLFTTEEKLSIMNEIRMSGEHDMAYLSTIESWDIFIKSVQLNFKFIGIMSKKSSFEEIAACHPSLMAFSEIIFLSHWSKQKMVDNAKLILTDYVPLNSKMKENLAHLFSLFHSELREKFSSDSFDPLFSMLTNVNFEIFVERFCELYLERYNSLQERREKLNSALEIVNMSSNINIQHKKKLNHEQVVYEQKIQSCNTLLVQIGQDQAISDEQIRLIKKTKTSMQKLEKILPQYEETHKRSVFKAAAVVRETKEIISNIDMKALANLRFMQKPDNEVEDVLAAVIIIIKSPTSDLTWNRGAKRIMANLERFKEEMISFDETHLPQSTMDILQSYVNKPHFVPFCLSERMQNMAINSLITYVRGVIRYNYLMQSYVKPFLEKVNQTKQQLHETRQKLLTLGNKSRDVQLRLETLTKEFEEATIEKVQQSELIDELKKALVKASQFEKVLKKLSSNWTSMLKNVDDEESNMFSELLLTSAFSVYLSCSSYEIREKVIMQCWIPILKTQNVNVKIQSQFGVGIFSDMRKDGVNEDLFEYNNIRSIISNSLCGEKLCRNILMSRRHLIEIENVSMLGMKLTKRTFLISDPEKAFQSMLYFIRQQDQEVIELDLLDSDSNFVPLMERAITNGHLLVIHNIENVVDNLLMSAMIAAYVARNITEKCYINFNNQRLCFNPRFQLVLLAHSKQPNFCNELFSLCEYINLSLLNKNVVAEISHRILSAYQYGDFHENIKENNRSYFLMKELLMQIDYVIISKISHRMEGSYTLKNADEITVLVELREEILNEFILSSEKVRTTNSAVNSHSTIGLPIAQLLWLSQHIDHWERYYIFSCNKFMEIFNDVLDRCFERNVHDHLQIPDVDLSSDQLQISGVEDVRRIHESIQLTMKASTNVDLRSVSDESLEGFLNSFSQKLQDRMRSMLKPDDLQVFVFIQNLIIQRQHQFVNTKLLEILFFGHNVDLIDCSLDSKPSWISTPVYKTLYNVIKADIKLAKIMDNLEALKTWYFHPAPESLSFPIDDIDDLSCFYATVAMRPDRLYDALKCYVLKQLNKSSPLSYELLETTKQPIVFIDDAEGYCPEDIIADFAKQMNVNIEVINISEDSENFDSKLTSVVQKDSGYLLIQDIDKRDEQFTRKLFKRCRRLQSQFSDSKWKIFIVSETCLVFSEVMLRFYHMVSTKAFVGVSNLSGSSSFVERIRENLIDCVEFVCDHLPPEDSLNVIYKKTLILLCCWHAYVLSCDKIWSNEKVPITCLQLAVELLSRQVSENEQMKIDDVIENYVDICLKNIYWNLDDVQQLSLDEIFGEIVMKPLLHNADHVYVSKLKVSLPGDKSFSDHKKLLLAHLNSLVVDEANVKLSTRNVTSYAMKSRDDIRSNKLSDQIKLTLQQAKMINLSDIFDSLSPSTNSKQVPQHLSSVISHLVENLPSQLPLPINDNVSMQSRELVEYVAQEFAEFNRKLSSIAKTLSYLSDVNISRSCKYSNKIKLLVDSLSRGYAPTNWLFENEEDKLLNDWIEDLKKRRLKMFQFSTNAMNTGSHVDLDTFRNPEKFLYVVKCMAANTNDVSIDEIYWQCVFDSNNFNVNSSLFQFSITSLYVDNFENDVILTDVQPSEDDISESSFQKLPAAVLRAAVMPIEHGFIRCALLRNKNSRHVIENVYVVLQSRDDIFSFNRPKFFISLK